MTEPLDLRFQRKYISAAEMESFFDAIPAETEEGRMILGIARAYLHSYKSIDHETDIIALHRCPICKRFPSFSYDKEVDSTTTNPTLEISVRCKCTVGVRTRYIFPSCEMQRVDRGISEAEHSAVNHWNDLAEERKKEADNG